MTTAAYVNRRDFLKETTAGLTLALTIRADPSLIIGNAAADTPLPVNLWVSIATDGTITLVSPPAEMGQGTFTALAAVLADELDADWSQVKACPSAGMGRDDLWQSGIFQLPPYRREHGHARLLQ